jgi:DNA-binding HxlR family transcriptional regulator
MNEKPHLSCPLAQVALLLSDTWTIRIIHSLLAKEHRFCELERALSGISTRTLTLKLSRLVNEGIAQKSESGYSLTKKGKQLKGVLSAMEKFGASV